MKVAYVWVIIGRGGDDWTFNLEFAVSKLVPNV